MVRLYLFAEGQTEQTFANTVLIPHLAKYGVFLNNTIMIAHARKKGIVHRGGAIRYQPMKDDIQRFQRQEKSTDVRFTTMIDLYGLMTDFPRFESAKDLPPRQRVQVLEAAFLQDIGDRRFIPYIQLHEYEALLFSDIECLATLFEKREKQVEELATIIAQFESPELINDGPQTAPSKRIIQHIPEYKNLKTTVGPLAAEHIGLITLRSCCPHFDEWVTQLELLGGVLEMPTPNALV